MGVYCRWYNQRNSVNIRQIFMAVVMSVILCVAGLPTAARAQAEHGAVDFTSQVQGNQPQQDQPQLVQVGETDTSVTITWPNPAMAVASSDEMANVALDQLPRLRYQGYELPMQLISVVVDERGVSASDAETAPEEHNGSVALQQVDAKPWSATIVPATPLQPPAIGWETMADPLRAVETVALPTAPLFLLRQGIVDGAQVAVYALSPIYNDQGTVKLATALSATIPHAQLSGQTQSEQSALASRTGAPTDFTPTNPLAARQAVKLVVVAAGIQEVTGEQLANAGLNLTTADPAKLQVTLNGAAVALELEGLSNNRLTATSRLRFYAETVGDRWNTESVYWLTVGANPGLRMTTRAVAPAGAQRRSTVWEQGSWQQNQLYESRYAGLDQDHWFHQKMILGDETVAPLEMIQVGITPHLPRVAGSATYTIAVTTNVRGSHTLRTLVNGNMQEVTWSTLESGRFAQNWQQHFTSTVTGNTLGIGLVDLAAANPQSDMTVLLDRVSWQQPVGLQFQQQGAWFTGAPGTWHYEWSTLPAGYRLYDVTDAAGPVLLTGATAAGFEDGPEAHRYLLTGPGTLHTPTAVRHDPVTFGTTGADAIYIAPAQFISALEPLLQLRRAQGYAVAVVDVAQLYDAWSYGHLSAEAIRSFLRYAHANWTPTPIAVTLVGDGTWDPHDYEEKHNSNFIPPYLADVDPWLGEASCDNCYVQLDGDDPASGDGLFDTEMWIGRLPVKGSGELDALVQKIIAYETSEAVGLWQNRVVFVADNYVRVQAGGTVTYDLAGDFAEYADNIAALSPGTVNNTRIYYDPLPSLADPEGVEPWRIPDATLAFRSVIQNLSYGAGIVSYNGHSNQWQWGVTDENNPNVDTNYLLGLFDADVLTNKDRYFIGFSMTCLTGQFHKPAISGTVLDERLLLNPNGGAVAVWGPTGLSVAYGHDLLQKGFLEKLWSLPSRTARIGELVDAGYAKLRAEQSCCQDTLKTFILFGDPLTKVQIRPEGVEGLYLPIISR